MATLISLPRNRIHKREETKRLNNLPSNFVESFYKDWLDGIDFSQDTDFQQQLVNNTPSKDVKKKIFWQRASLAKRYRGKLTCI